MLSDNFSKIRIMYLNFELILKNGMGSCTNDISFGLYPNFLNFLNDSRFFCARFDWVDVVWSPVNMISVSSVIMMAKTKTGRVC